MTLADTKFSASFHSKCREAHGLVQAFLNDSLPEDHLAQLLPVYKSRPQRRLVVKEKVKKSLEVLYTALEKHGYVVTIEPFVNHMLTLQSTRSRPLLQRRQGLPCHAMFASCCHIREIHVGDDLGFPS